MKKLIIIAAVLMSGSAVHSQTVLSLDQCKTLATENNMGLKNSALELEAAKEVKKNAYTNYFPKVSASLIGMQAIDPLMEVNMPGGDLPVYDGNPANLPSATQFAYFPGIEMGILQEARVGAVNIAQPLYTGGRISNGNKLAQIGVEVKEKQQKLSHDQVLLLTERQYWQIVSLQEKQKTLAKYEELLGSVYNQVNDAYKAGLIIKNDVLKVQLKQSELKINKNKLQNGKKLALMQFCQTIGTPYDSSMYLVEDIQSVQLPTSFYTSADEAMYNRTEYQLLEQSVKAQQYQTKMAKGEYMPQVAVGVSGYYLDGVMPGTDATTNGLLYASVSIPISDWWGGSHKIKEQKIKEKMAQNTFIDTQSMLKLQMEKGWTDLNEAYQQVMIMHETDKQAEENLKVTHSSYDSGVVTVSDLLEAQAIQLEAADKLIEAKTKYKLALATYLQNTGRS